MVFGSGEETFVEREEVFDGRVEWDEVSEIGEVVAKGGSDLEKEILQLGPHRRRRRGRVQVRVAARCCWLLLLLLL